MTDPLRVEEPERTAVGTGEEHLFNIGLLPGHGINMLLVFVRLSGQLPSFDLMMTVLANGLAVFGSRISLRSLLFSVCAEGWDKLDATFVEG